MKDNPLILVVDRNHKNLELLTQFLGREGYQVLTGSSMEEFEQALMHSKEVNLALVDIAGFDRQICDVCFRLRTENISFSVLSHKLNIAIQQQSLTHGARSMLVKPLVIKLLGIIRSELRTT
ncbi:MAG TPA: response regulator [Cyanobacteria bacterium UBA11049]|nr:response regulator [Cyanobacteria bacterium UBA11049]